MKISFDVWGTLWRANPGFRQAKVNLARRFFELSSSVTDDDVLDCYNYVKGRNDFLVERYGCQPDRYTMFCEFVEELRKHDSGIATQMHLWSFINEYEELFLANLPALMPGAAGVLHKLKLAGHTLAVSSNTLLIDQETMIRAMDRNGIYDVFSEFYFSDKVGVSKPSGAMFPRNTEWHVGDNPVTDGGCAAYGINFYQVHSNNKTLHDFANEAVFLGI